jgi:RNA polymerase sigma-70 factor (ECF subfamily)
MEEPVNQAGNVTDQDAILVKAFQQGDKEAFDRLVQTHQKTVFNICYRFLGDYSEANDHAQETFIKAFRSICTFRFEASFSTWLYRIAVNTCINRLNSKSYRQQKKLIRFEGKSGTEKGGMSFEPADPNPFPLSQLELKEKEDLIKKAIGSLPSDQKAVVVLRDIEGMSYEEIAAVTGSNLGTVKSRLARGRQLLKNMLKDYLG